MTELAAPLRVAVAQIDTTVGDFEGNAAKILELGRRAEREGAHLVLFPELAVCGYPPRDLVERPAFVAASERAAERIARASRDALWVFGSLWGNRGARAAGCSTRPSPPGAAAASRSTESACCRPTTSSTRGATSSRATAG